MSQNVEEMMEVAAQCRETKVIAGYWGIGKKTFMKALPTICMELNREITAVNLIATDYHYIQVEKNPNLKNSGTRNINPEWPRNYIRAIKEYMGRVDYIFISTTSDIQEAMWIADIDFTLIYPEPSLYYEYIGRYIDSIYRADTSPKKDKANYNRVGQMLRMWHNDIRNFEKDTTRASEVISLGYNEFLADALLGYHISEETLATILEEEKQLKAFCKNNPNYNHQ